MLEVHVVEPQFNVDVRINFFYLDISKYEEAFEAAGFAPVEWIQILREEKDGPQFLAKIEELKGTISFRTYKK